MSITRMEGQEFRVTAPAKQTLGHRLPVPAQQPGPPLPPSQWATIHNLWDRTFCYSLPEVIVSTRRPAPQVVAAVTVVLVTGTVTVEETMVNSHQGKQWWNWGSLSWEAIFCHYHWISSQYISQLWWQSRSCQWNIIILKLKREPIWTLMMCWSANLLVLGVGSNEIDPKPPPTKTSIFQTWLFGLISANYMWPPQWSCCHKISKAFVLESRIEWFKIPRPVFGKAPKRNICDRINHIIVTKCHRKVPFLFGTLHCVDYNLFYLCSSLSGSIYYCSGTLNE